MTRLFGCGCTFSLCLPRHSSVGCAVVQPAWITVVLPWPASPLNARFIAALYLMGAITALLCLFARHYVEMRIALIQIGWVTGVLLLITLPHVGEFTPTTFPYRWVIFYTIDPVTTRLSFASTGSVASASIFYPNLYKDFSHVVRINYYPPRGDNKEGWDAIDIFRLAWIHDADEDRFYVPRLNPRRAAVLDLAFFIDLAQRPG